MWVKLAENVSESVSPSSSAAVADIQTVIDGIAYTDQILYVIAGILVAGFIAVLFLGWWR